MRSPLFLLFLLTPLISGRCAGDDTAPARFYRAVNLNGPALVIDGNPWEAGDSSNVRCQGNAFENQSVRLRPTTDPERTRMIRSSRWGRSIDVDLLNVEPAECQVCLYVWEDNDSTSFSVTVNDQKSLENYSSGPGGTWKRLGPWKTRPVKGVIRITAKGGDANLSGIELWSGDGTVPNPLASAFNIQPTPDDLTFFESKIRPVLVKHCYECHGFQASEPGGNLLLDSRPAILKGGDTEPPIVPGDPDASLMMRAVRYADPDLKMPPAGKLASHEIADLERWIRLGAPDPRTADTAAMSKSKSVIDWEQARDFWSLKPVIPPVIPAVQDQNWPTGELDRFVLAKIESAGLRPAPDAEKSVLLRRVTFDLIGLPPSLSEIRQFLSDDSPGAYRKVVDRLLESPQYGERWGRHWLDVVRYSDTAGDNSDFPIPQMYRYRNWVIDALNRDLPYDDFVREQLAGDLIGGEGEVARQRLIATGYIANARRFGSRVDDYPQHLTIEDTLDNLGRTFLATTINCARCHNHKFDPLTTNDYYGLYGIFQSTRYPWPGIELEQRQRDLIPLIDAAEAQRILDQRRKRQDELDARVKELEKLLTAAEGDQRKEFKRQLEDARQQAVNHARTPLPFELAYAVTEGKIEDAAIQHKGDPAKRGDLVPRHFPAMLHGSRLADNDRSSGRLQLANWIVDRNNPLTARVMVNRIWLHHFGKGLAQTPNDFGRQGKRPTNPELLDYLATQFMNSGWSIKAMHRQILLSRTYRLSSQSDDHAISVDPTNDLLSRFPRRRLDAESLRDTLLLLSGNLDPTPGGPHPFPPQSEWKFTQHNPFKAVYDSNRRSVYLMTQRIQRHPYLAIFDGPDPAASTPQRLTSTTPIQALYLLNDAFVHEQAAGLARRLLMASDRAEQRIEMAYLMVLNRSPDREDIEMAVRFLADVKQTLKVPADQLELECWQSMVRAMFRLNEFLYLD